MFYKTPEKDKIDEAKDLKRERNLSDVEAMRTVLRKYEQQKRQEGKTMRTTREVDEKLSRQCQKPGVSKNCGGP
jgi:hypothetical protein